MHFDYLTTPNGIIHHRRCLLQFGLVKSLAKPQKEKEKEKRKWGCHSPKNCSTKRNSGLWRMEFLFSQGHVWCKIICINSNHLAQEKQIHLCCQKIAQFGGPSRTRGLGELGWSHFQHIPYTRAEWSMHELVLQIAWSLCIGKNKGKLKEHEIWGCTSGGYPLLKSVSNTSNTYHTKFWKKGWG